MATQGNLTNTWIKVFCHFIAITRFLWGSLHRRTADSTSVSTWQTGKNVFSGSIGQLFACYIRWTAAHLGCNYAAESQQTVLCCPVFCLFSKLHRSSASTYIVLWHYGNKVAEPSASPIQPWADASGSEATNQALPHFPASVSLPGAFLDVQCGSPPHPYSHPQPGLLSCAGVWSIAHLSPWSSSTRILLAQSPRTSLRSGTLAKERTLSLSQSLDEIQITDHLPLLCSFLFGSQEASPSRPLPPAPCNHSCLLFCALSFCQLMRQIKRSAEIWCVTSWKMENWAHKSHVRCCNVPEFCTWLYIYLYIPPVIVYKRQIFSHFIWRCLIRSYLQS